MTIVAWFVVILNDSDELCWCRTLACSVASAYEEDLPDDALVIDGHIDELGAGALGFVEGVGHKGGDGVK